MTVTLTVNVPTDEELDTWAQQLQAIEAAVNVQSGGMWNLDPDLRTLFQDFGIDRLMDSMSVLVPTMSGLVGRLRGVHSEMTRLTVENIKLRDQLGLNPIDVGEKGPAN